METRVNKVYKSNEFLDSSREETKCKERGRLGIRMASAPF